MQPWTERGDRTRVTLGDNVKIQNNVHLLGVVLEDDVFCGPSMVFTNVGTPGVTSPAKASTWRPVSVAAPPSGPTPPSCVVTPSDVTLSWGLGRW